MENQFDKTEINLSVNEWGAEKMGNVPHPIFMAIAGVSPISKATRLPIPGPWH